MQDKFCFKPINLRLDRGNSKIAVTENPTPVFSWGAFHSENNQYQTEAKVEVYCEENLLYNSGWIVKKEQELIYSGKPFTNGKRIDWFVSLRDVEGRESTRVKESFIYSDPDEIKAYWIGKENIAQRTAIYFSKKFNINKKVKRAVFNVCGLGLHKAYINGLNTDVAVLQPPVSSYDKIIYYTVNEISPDIFKMGENVISVILADGWRANYGFWCEPLLKDRDVPFMGNPQLLAQLDIFFDDGSEEHIITDETWQSADSPCSTNLFDGETFDASKEPKDWKVKGLDPSTTSNAILVSPPGGKLHPQNFESIRLHNRYKPKYILHTDEGFLCDFGVNIAGVCELIIPQGMKHGERISIEHAERVDSKHRLQTDTIRLAKSIDTYICSGEEEPKMMWRPEFTYHGFQFALIKGIDELSEDMICAVEMYNDIDSKSFFYCGNPTVNEIQKAIVRTERNNMHHLFTDCPQRDERMGWMNDATVRFDQIPYNFDIGAMFPKIIRDEISEQSDEGAITCTAPFLYGYRPADPVCSAYIIAGIKSLLFTGNSEIVQEAFLSYKSWNKYLKGMCDEEGILYHSHYGDWAAPVAGCVAEENARSAVTPSEVMSTAFHYFNYKLIAEIAKLINNQDEVKANLEEAENVKKAFLKKWVDEKSGNVSTGSMGCLTIALYTGIIEGELANKTARLLHEELVRKDYSLTTGNINTKYIYDVLTQYGYIDDAWKLITRLEYPSLGFMLANGATSIWERFEDKENSQMNSHNHPMYGAVGSWFYEYIAGIKPIEKGFDTFLIKPHFPKELRFVQACVDTVKGKVYIKWIKKGGKIEICFNVPFGCEAVLNLFGKMENFKSGFYHKCLYYKEEN